MSAPPESESPPRPPSSVSVPALVAWGANDPFFPPSQPRRMAGAMPDARLLMLPGCGHFVAEEVSRELAAAVERFAGGIVQEAEAGARRGCFPAAPGP